MHRATSRARQSGSTAPNHCCRVNRPGHFMNAVVFHGIGDIRLDKVREPTIDEPNDAIVRLTASAICGTDLHFVRGTMSAMKPGTILGHEGVGIVEENGLCV